MLRPCPTCLPHGDPQAESRTVDFTHWGSYPSSRDGETVRGIIGAVLFCVYKVPSTGSLCSIGCIGLEHTGWKYHSEGSWEQTSAHHERCQTSHHDPHGASADTTGASGAMEGVFWPSLAWMSHPSGGAGAGMCVCVCVFAYQSIKSLWKDTQELGSTSHLCGGKWLAWGQDGSNGF